ncbi:MULTISPECIES: AraC family transcriptional regulator [unclassified Pseudomonas]|uniref:AraC family transcriptional regulator n=1 Tax=unclassified Pseudomonas TaxID=196821 RepID=UPI0024497E64|nr:MULTISPECIES: AraC family transcriptional regulator [unclassified Pseudomonas]MDH0300438.1 AraC family transcriptional regulator [Pseudomonas sp. GD04091]MDH1987120.1 AraC family transcriptional regulator [Pseudomonas sp. GD03689]
MPLTCSALHACTELELSWVRAGGGASFARHTHDEYVLGANLRGHEQIWLDGRELDVPVRQVTLYNPLAVQGSTFGPDGVEYVSLHLSTDALRQVIRDNNLRSTDQPPVFQQGILEHPALFTALTDLAQSAEAEREQALLSLFAQLLEQPCATPGEQSAAIARSQAAMRANLDCRLGLDQLAALAGLSKYHFARCFKKATGLGPLQYHMQLRLIEARRRLRRGQHPQDVAHDLGFYDQSHFITAFRRVHGFTPQQYATRYSGGLTRMNSR